MAFLSTGTLVTTSPSSRRTSRQGGTPPLRPQGRELADGHLADVRAALDAAGLTVHIAFDHRVSRRAYISDPDGNLIEL